MEFVKKHYEKIILSVILLGLVGVLVGMWFAIMADKQYMANLRTTYFGAPQPLPALSLSREDAAMRRLGEPYQLDFSETNKLFNPVQWERTEQGKLIKLVTGREVGPYAAVITKINRLYFSVQLESVLTNFGAQPRYVLAVQNQAAPYRWQRNVKRHYISKGERINGVFTLTAVTGPPDNPTSLTLTFPDGRMATLQAGKAWRQVEGYSADLKYSPERITRRGLRVGDQLNFAGDQYNVIAIDQNTVVLLAQSNQKKYLLRYQP
ncbi:MAG: hypothetical protein KGR98_04335 [Verrucomicrobia bacterium]|nr:hypothetical protein [Verrucomicrobiota bacterium]MDE3099227.1 hypothetical protein [Verrucomicrobiota bacterium]